MANPPACDPNDSQPQSQDLLVKSPIVDSTARWTARTELRMAGPWPISYTRALSSLRKSLDTRVSTKVIGAEQRRSSAFSSLGSRGGGRRTRA